MVLRKPVIRWEINKLDLYLTHNIHKGELGSFKELRVERNL